MTKTMLIAGASGVVGRAACEHFAARPDWRVIGVSRRSPAGEPTEHVSLDLNDREACARALGALDGVTHVVYAALFEKPGLFAGWREQDQMQTNLAMLRNFMDPLADRRTLVHVSVLQGTKAYGAHVRPMKVPGKEREARVPHENFYWLQEDYLRALARDRRWSFTIWRPPLIVGHAIGAPMNVMAALGIYAAVRRAERKPFSWPGGVTGPIDAVDARLLAEAFAWAAGDERGANAAAANETFNVTNGDVVVMRNIWPTLAGAFGLEEGEPEPQRLAETLPRKATVWDAVVQQYGLRVPGVAAFAGDSLLYADMLLGAGRDALPVSPLLSGVKIRKAGFGGCIDSEDMFVEWIERLQRRKVFPPR